MSCNWEVMPSLIASWNRQINWQRKIVEVYQCSIPERSIQDKPISQEKLIHVLQLEKCTPGKNVLLEKCTPQKNVPAGSLLWTEKNHWRQTLFQENENAKDKLSNTNAETNSIAMESSWGKTSPRLQRVKNS